MHVWFFGHQVIWKNKISSFVLRSMCNKIMFKSNQYAQYLNLQCRVLLFYLFWKWDALSQFTFAHKWPLTDQRPRRVSMHRANFRNPLSAYVAVFDNVNSVQWRLTTKCMSPTDDYEYIADPSRKCLKLPSFTIKLSTFHMKIIEN